jgi:predicted TIM-barrel fold metal-dependent hydrolase
MAGTYTTDSIPIVDVDSHLTEPAGLWVDHAPTKLKELVPKIVEDEHGRPRWFVDGNALGPIGNALVGPEGAKIQGELSTTAHRFEEIHKGAYDMNARLAWLDEHGIAQQAMFPNIPGFGASRFVTAIADEELRTACVKIYNDAIAEIQQESGGRLLPYAFVPWWNLDETVNELRRIRDLGLIGITMCDSPHEYGLPALDQPEWDAFWSNCEDLGMAIAFHIGSGGAGISQLRWSQVGGEFQMTNTVNSFFANCSLVANLICSGVLLKHPRLRIFSAESGVGWVPFLLEALDYQWHENLTIDVQREVWKEMLPSEIFRRNIFVSYWFERKGLLHALDVIGEDNVMFETDFPHGTALSDRVDGEVAETLAGLSASVRQKVLHDNAARLFDLPRTS